MRVFCIPTRRLSRRAASWNRSRAAFFHEGGVRSIEFDRLDSGIREPLRNAGRDLATHETKLGWPHEPVEVAPDR